MALRHSTKTTKCNTCQKDGLYWIFHQVKKKTVLLEKVVDKYGNTRDQFHECDVDIKPAKCNYCDTKDLMYVKKADGDKFKFEMVESYGLNHVCQGFADFHSAWREAKRMNYAIEKRWVKSLPEDAYCVQCKGRGYVSFSKRGTTRSARCYTCKGIGRYTEDNKKVYLKALRKAYWPWRLGMKWKWHP